jgi:hypothetical protein
LLALELRKAGHARVYPRIFFVAPGRRVSRGSHIRYWPTQSALSAFEV